MNTNHETNTRLPFFFQDTTNFQQRSNQEVLLT